MSFPRSYRTSSNKVITFPWRRRRELGHLWINPPIWTYGFWTAVNVINVADRRLGLTDKIHSRGSSFFIERLEITDQLSKGLGFHVICFLTHSFRGCFPSGSGRLPSIPVVDFDVKPWLLLRPDTVNTCNFSLLQDLTRDSMDLPPISFRLCTQNRDSMGLPPISFRICTQNPQVILLLPDGRCFSCDLFLSEATP